MILFYAENDVARNYVCNLCVKHIFTRGIATLAALVRVNVPLVGKSSFLHTFPKQPLTILCVASMRSSIFLVACSARGDLFA
jgi:hypothetical protein